MKNLYEEKLREETKVFTGNCQVVLGKCNLTGDSLVQFWWVEWSDSLEFDNIQSEATTDS